MPTNLPNAFHGGIQMLAVYKVYKVYKAGGVMWSLRLSVCRSFRLWAG